MSSAHLGHRATARCRSDHRAKLSLSAFFKILATAANIFEILRSKISDDLESLNKALDAGVALASQMAANDFKLDLGTQFNDILRDVSNICFSRQAHSARSYVALIKIHARLLEKIDKPIPAEGHIADLVHNIAREIESSVKSDSDQNWKFVAFLIKRVAYISNKCSFCSADLHLIGAVVRLYELRLSEHHPLNKTTEQIELWKLVDPMALRAVPNGNLGIGFVLLSCDIAEGFLESVREESDIEFFLRAIYDHASEIVEFMFHRVNHRSVFDHCLHILCRGSIASGSFNIFDEANSANCTYEKRLLRDEVYRYFNRKTMRTQDKTSIFEKFEEDPTSVESEQALSTFFESAFDTPLISMNPAEVQMRIAPCSPNSALLFSLVSTLCSSNATSLVSLEDLVALVAELVETVKANPENDCIFIAACIFFTYTRDFALRNVQSVAIQSPLKKLKEIVSHLRQNEVLNAFGATSLAVFAFGTDLPTWLTLRCPSHEKYFRSFGKKFDHQQWHSTLQLLKTGEASSRPVNSYVLPTHPTKPATVSKPAKEPFVAELFKVVSKLGSSQTHRNNLTAEDCQILKLCIEKIESILNSS